MNCILAEKRRIKKHRIIVVQYQEFFWGVFTTNFIIRVKNDRELKSRVLFAILSEKPSFSVKEYKEVPDPSDSDYQIISITAYEKGPYRHLPKILEELIKAKEIECLTGLSSDLS
jgi:hypothetical protein